MKYCSLKQFAESLEQWLAHDYIRGVAIDAKGRVSLTFMDGVKETYQISGGDRAQILRACRCLS